MQKYQTLIFDCDGVLLDSNRVKTEAFRTVAAQFGDGPAEALVRYHTQNGGISRYRKFEHLLVEILKREAETGQVEMLAQQYGDCVERDLLECAVAPGLIDLRAKTADASWMVVSGGDQTQLQRIFAARGLTGLFDGGIFGSPTSKDEILAREMASGAIRKPAIYFGDSRYDHIAAKRAGLDFVFVHAWSEFADWQQYTAENEIHVVREVAHLEQVLFGRAAPAAG